MTDKSKSRAFKVHSLYSGVTHEGERFWVFSSHAEAIDLKARLKMLRSNSMIFPFKPVEARYRNKHLYSVDIRGKEIIRFWVS